MKLVVVNIEYNKEIGDNEYDDIISITCPFKQYSVSLQRADVNDFLIANIIEEKEYENFKKIGDFFKGGSIKFTIKIEDSDYNLLFRDFLNYPAEKRVKDVSNMFIYLRWKIAEVMNNVELYKKFTENIDIDGSMDGCLYCEELHANGYCKKNNKINPNKACCYYKFKKK